MFFFTSFGKDTTYSPECPGLIRLWLPVTYINFFSVQFLVIAYFRTSSRKASLCMWLFTSFFLIPSMLFLNLWGNLIIEKMDNDPYCSYNGWAQTFQMIYLIAVYCVVFVYLIFLVTIKETMKRFYVQIDRVEGQRVPRAVEERCTVIKGRSCKDAERALAYSLFLLNDGRIGSRAEREYLVRERVKIQYEKMASAIKTFVFNC